MRTGSRCTTLTKFPVAFSGGRSDNREPVAGLKTAHAPLKTLPG